MGIQFNDGNYKGFEASEAIPKYSRVKLLSTGKVAIAGLAEKEIGVAWNECASGDTCSVRLRTAAGTHIGIAKEAFSVGATLYTEAGGKFQDTAEATAFQAATALSAAAADGDYFEFIYNVHGDTAAS